MRLDMTTKLHHNVKTGYLEIWNAETTSTRYGDVLIKEHFKDGDDLEYVANELERIAFAIREFRMKNFPESDRIE